MKAAEATKAPAHLSRSPGEQAGGRPGLDRLRRRASRLHEVQEERARAGGTGAPSRPSFLRPSVVAAALPSNSKRAKSARDDEAVFFLGTDGDVRAATRATARPVRPSAGFIGSSLARSLARGLPPFLPQSRSRITVLPAAKLCHGDRPTDSDTATHSTATTIWARMTCKKKGSPFG